MEATKFTIDPSVSAAYIDSPLIIEFDQDINPATVTSLSVLLYLVSGTAYNLYAYDYTVSGKNLTVKPKTNVPWAVNSKYNLVIANGAQGLLSTLGETLDSRVIYTFNTTNTTKPVDPTVIVDDTRTSENMKDAVDVVTGRDVEIIIPSTAPQGDMVPYSPCFPFNGITQSFGETGIINSGSGIGLLIAGGLVFLGSVPTEFSVGVMDITQIVVVWDKDITIQTDPAVEMTWQDLPMPIDPFSRNPAVAAKPSIALGSRLFSFFEPIDTLNKEFTLRVNPGRLVTTEDPSVFNMDETIVFSGPLSPMFCSLEVVVSKSGMWGINLSNKAQYYYWKLIHQESVFAMQAKGYASVADIPPDQLVELSRYVCCNVALQLLTSGEGNINRSAYGGKKPFIKQRTLPGVSLTYDMIDSSTKSKSPEDTTTQMLRDCVRASGIANFADWEPIKVKAGVKSGNDRRFPAMRRL